MGYTKIFPIKRSFSNGSGGMIATVLYNTKDKLKELDLEKVNLNDRESVKEALKVIEYVSGDKTEKEKIVFETVTSYINCSPDPYYAAKEMKQVRVRYNKDGDDIIGYHLIQSVKESPAMVDIEKFHDIGVQLATEVFDGFQVVVSTHINTDNGKTLEDLNTKYRSITMENGNTVYRFRTEDDITLIKDILDCS